MISALLLSSLLLPASAPATPQHSDGFRSLADRVQARTLKNGLRVLVLPRGEAPVAAFRLYVRTGSVDEVTGQTGLAHFAEHMAFKGSERIGARDWEAERAALEACDKSWAQYEAAATLPASQRDPEEIARRREAFEKARAAADDLCISGAFDHAMEEAGGLDQNAGTGSDSTEYHVSLPVNRLEQYFWLTREQMGAPVMREFYKERDVVKEERRMRTDSSAFGALMEAVTNAAFVAHPYRDSTIGHMDDLEFLDRPEMIAFWRRHYTADRMVLCVVGKVNPQEVFRLAEEYLSDLPAGTQPRPRRTMEPEQKGERVVKVTRPAAPLLMVGWKSPALVGRSRLVIEALGGILVEGSSSRLYTRLVKQERAAADVDWISGFPGELDPGLFLVIAEPVPGHSLDECLSLAQEEIDRLAAEEPDEREMAGMRRRAKMDLLQRLESDQGLAGALCEAEAEQGGYRTLFDTLDELESITAEEVAAAAAAMTVGKRTVGYLLPPGMEPDDAQPADEMMEEIEEVQ